jgi:hypothetical protein
VNSQRRAAAWALPTRLTFDFDNFSAAGATATLVGNTLSVQYTILMSLSDFEDAIYVLDAARQAAEASRLASQNDTTLPN